jgi:hypothetical protein
MTTRPLVLRLHHACDHACWRCRRLWASRVWLGEAGGACLAPNLATHVAAFPACTQPDEDA